MVLKFLGRNYFVGKVSIGVVYNRRFFPTEMVLDYLELKDPSAIKSGSDVKVQAISTGANVTGNLAATGNVTALMVHSAVINSTRNHNFSDTAVTSVDSLAVDGNITQIQI